MDLRAHHERRRHSVIGILALIAQVNLVATPHPISGGFDSEVRGISPRSPAAFPTSARSGRSILNYMHQQQDKHDQHYQAKTTPTVVADSKPHAIAAETFCRAGHSAEPSQLAGRASLRSRPARPAPGVRCQPAKPFKSHHQDSS